MNINCLPRTLYTAFVIFIILVNLSATTVVQATLLPNVFINELHYDNVSGDKNEFVELAGDADINLHNWSLHFYNGDTGTVYKKHTFSTETFKNSHNNFGFIAVKISGIQNGSPDGIVLADASNTIIQFLSYEGIFTAIDGIANGFTSTDIGFQEYANTPSNYSLQLTGQGSFYSDFLWSSAKKSSFENINLNQRLTRVEQKKIKVKEPNSAGLFVWIFILFLSYTRICKI